MTIEEAAPELDPSYLEAERAEQILRAARKYGAITRGEAAIRVGEKPAALWIDRFLKKKLFTQLSHDPNSKEHDVFGFTSRVMQLMDEGKPIKQLLEPFTQLTK